MGLPNADRLGFGGDKHPSTICRKVFHVAFMHEGYFFYKKWKIQSNGICYIWFRYLLETLIIQFKKVSMQELLESCDCHCKTFTDCGRKVSKFCTN